MTSGSTYSVSDACPAADRGRATPRHDARVAGAGRLHPDVLVVGGADDLADVRRLPRDAVGRAGDDRVVLGAGHDDERVADADPRRSPSSPRRAGRPRWAPTSGRRPSATRTSWPSRRRRSRCRGRRTRRARRAPRACRRRRRTTRRRPRTSARRWRGTAARTGRRESTSAAATAGSTPSSSHVYVAPGPHRRRILRRLPALGGAGDRRDAVGNVTVGNARGRRHRPWCECPGPRRGGSGTPRRGR